MVFVDTWGWLALALKRDQHHAAATTQHDAFRQAGHRYVTTDLVLSELITQLYLSLPPAQAQSFIAAILAAADRGEYLVLHISTDRFLKAWEMRQSYDDKPDISFVDFTSIVVMQELGVGDIFTGDQHFRQVNLGFRLFP